MKLLPPHPLKRLLIVVLISFVLVLLYQFSFLVRVVWFNFYNPSSSAVMRERP